MDRIKNNIANLWLVSSRKASKGNASFFDEADFKEIIRLEEKRSQRSMKSILMMHLDISSLMNSSYAHNHSLLLKAFETGIRDTDIRGWIKQGSIVGILFTEIEPASTSVRKILFRRVMAHLVHETDPSAFFKVKVSFQIYTGGKVWENTAEYFDMRYSKYYPCNIEKQNLLEEINRKIDVALNCKTFTALLTGSLQDATPQSTLKLFE